MISRLQRHIQNSVKHLRWSVLPKKISLRNTIVDVWHGSEYTSGLRKLFCHGSQSDTPDCVIYAKLIIVFTPNLEFLPYSEVLHGSTILKLTKC